MSQFVSNLLTSRYNDATSNTLSTQGDCVKRCWFARRGKRLFLKIIYFPWSLASTNMTKPHKNQFDFKTRWCLYVCTCHIVYIQLQCAFGHICECTRDVYIVHVHEGINLIEISDHRYIYMWHIVHVGAICIWRAHIIYMGCTHTELDEFKLGQWVLIQDLRIHAYLNGCYGPNFLKVDGSI